MHILVKNISLPSDMFVYPLRLKSYIISQKRQAHATFARTDSNFVIILLFLCEYIYIIYTFSW